MSIRLKPSGSELPGVRLLMLLASSLRLAGDSSQGFMSLIIQRSNSYQLPVFPALRFRELSLLVKGAVQVEFLHTTCLRVH
ncbi:hypothetical protein E2C01_048421 [Portunus trituberculatus]|uniref:Uncharacterized protein n=1 Tax=Portunus trituberculatus TaxID=210409 RepID=A0A5B7G6D3_PORTR|nr:hypothetical protein [Portunus trituberculatus]